MTSPFAKELLEIYKIAVDAVKPSRIIQNSIRLDKNRLLITQAEKEDVSVDLENCNIHIIGGGKSVLGMAIALAELVSKSNLDKKLSFSHGCLSVPMGLKQNFMENGSDRSLLNLIDTNVLFGTVNNLPDQSSIEASASLLKSVEDAAKFDKSSGKSPLFLVLLSGGGSACLTSPHHLDIHEKLHMIKFLTQQGANIVELNIVRRYFSRIKGGNLAKFIMRCHPNARLISLIISDVVGNPIEYIASGPTVIYNSGSHREKMMNVLRKYNFPIRECFTEPEHDVFMEHGVTNIIIGSNQIALNILRREAELLNYRVEYLGGDLTGSTEEVLFKLTNHVDEILLRDRPNKLLVVGGGESTVFKEEGQSWGLGGRLQEMALDYLISRCYKSNVPNDVEDVLLAASTDGQDGPTDVAACLASCNIWKRDHTVDLEDLIRAKRTHDSYNFWSTTKPEWLIKTGLTGTNVMDLYMLALCRASI